MDNQVDIHFHLQKGATCRQFLGQVLYMDFAFVELLIGRGAKLGGWRLPRCGIRQARWDSFFSAFRLGARRKSCERLRARKRSTAPDRRARVLRFWVGRKQPSSSVGPRAQRIEEAQTPARSSRLWWADFVLGDWVPEIRFQRAPALSIPDAYFRLRLPFFEELPIGSTIRESRVSFPHSLAIAAGSRAAPLLGPPVVPFLTLFVVGRVPLLK